MRNNIFVSKEMGLYPGGLKTGGGLKVGFYGISSVFQFLIVFVTYAIVSSCY